MSVAGTHQTALSPDRNLMKVWRQNHQVAGILLLPVAVVHVQDGAAALIHRLHAAPIQATILAVSERRKNF
jgi:hypothetical protein